MPHELTLDSLLDAPDLIPTSSLAPALMSQQHDVIESPNNQIETPPPPATPILTPIPTNNAANAYHPTAPCTLALDTPLNHTVTLSTPEPALCFGCRQPILDRFLLSAVDVLWHENCLKCSWCGCRLGDVGSTFFTKSHNMLCKRDYLR